VERSIVTHLKKRHSGIWKEYVKVFAELRQRGTTSKGIMWHFDGVFSWTVVERALAEAGISPRPRTAGRLPLEPQNFELEQTTIWSFPNRGKWAVHDSSYRGNWAAEVPRNLILRYSESGDWVLDPFMGGGTTAIEAMLLGRKFVGFDINRAALELARRKINRLKARLQNAKEFNNVSEVRLFRGDARRMTRIKDDSIDLVCAHPPYMDIIEYTRKDPADLSTITNPDRYIREMRKIGVELQRCLKPGGILAVLVGDVRRRGIVIPLGTRMLSALTDVFEIEEVIVKVQHNAASTHFWKNKNHTFLRLAHEYLFVLRKPDLVKV
jgi:DNA modification methylase